MKNRFHRLLFAFACLATANFGPSVFAQVRQGTSHTGGGTGVDGRVFESFIVTDHSNLPGFKTAMNLLSKIKENDPTNYFFKDIFHIRTWYIAPVELHTVTKDSLGLNFIKTSLDQIARHSFKEIWINKTKYDALNKDEQSDLIIHEVVMGLYLSKYMTLKEICTTGNMTPDHQQECLNSEFVKRLDEIHPPQKFTGLTEKDNENIRQVVGWIKMNAPKGVSINQFITILNLNDFDKRIFNPDFYKEETTAALPILSPEEFFQILKGSDLTGHGLDECLSAKRNAKTSCQVQYSEERKVIYGDHYPLLKLKLKAEQDLNIDLMVGKDLSPILLSLPGNKLYLISLAQYHSMKIKLGTKSYIVSVLLKKEDHRGPFTLYAIVLQPNIVVSIDKKRDPVCLGRYPKVRDFNDDQIVIYDKDAPLNDTVGNFIQSLSAYMPCTADSVE